MLILERPLVSFDLEVTGLTDNDKIVQIGAIKLMPDGQRIHKEALFNPEMPISKGAEEVHGISDEMVKDAPIFRRVAKSLFRFLSDCDFTGYNLAKFDIPVLSREFAACGMEWPAKDAKILDAFSIALKQEPRDLTWAYKFYCDKQLENAHSALPDATASLDILLAQATKYQGTTDIIAMDDLQRDPSWLDIDGKFIETPDGKFCTFGKHKDTRIEDLPLDYLNWILSKDFHYTTKDVVKDELIRRKGLIGRMKKVKVAS